MDEVRYEKMTIRPGSGIPRPVVPLPRTSPFLVGGGMGALVKGLSSVALVVVKNAWQL